MLQVKILSILFAERYALRRLVTQAYQDLLTRHPELQIEIREIYDPSTIGQYARVLSLPTLVINEKVVSSGTHPTREQIGSWLEKAVAP